MSAWQWECSVSGWVECRVSRRSSLPKNSTFLPMVECFSNTTISLGEFFEVLKSARLTGPLLSSFPAKVPLTTNKCPKIGQTFSKIRGYSEIFHIYHGHCFWPFPDSSHSHTQNKKSRDRIYEKYLLFQWKSSSKIYFSKCLRTFPNFLATL